MLMEIDEDESILEGTTVSNKKQAEKEDNRTAFERIDERILLHKTKMQQGKEWYLRSSQHDEIVKALKKDHNGDTLSAYAILDAAVRSGVLCEKIP